MDWRSKAACLTVDPELFFPIGNTGPAISQVAEAKAVCRECDVKGICLQWAIDNNQDSGVWGRHERRRTPLAQTPRRACTTRRLLKTPRPYTARRPGIHDGSPASFVPAPPRQAGSRLTHSVTSVPPPSRGAHSIEPRSSPRTIW